MKFTYYAFQLGPLYLTWRDLWANTWGVGIEWRERSVLRIGFKSKPQPPLLEQWADEPHPHDEDDENASDWCYVCEARGELNDLGTRRAEMEHWIKAKREIQLLKVPAHTERHN